MCLGPVFLSVCERTQLHSRGFYSVSVRQLKVSHTGDFEVVLSFQGESQMSISEGDNPKLSLPSSVSEAALILRVLVSVCVTECMAI